MLIAAWGSGCGEDDGGGGLGAGTHTAGDGGPEARSPIDICKAMNADLCERLYTCFRHADIRDLERWLRFQDPATCAVAVSDGVCPDIAYAVEEDRINLYLDGTEDCGATLLRLSCDDVIQIFVGNVAGRVPCPELFVGTRAKGEDCIHAAECGEEAAQCSGNGRCSGALGGDSYERECTASSSSECDGLACLPLNPNLQRRAGMCTAPCEGHWDCGEGAVCADLEAGQLCLSTCRRDTDCAGGFVCVEANDEGDKVCFVRTG